MIQNIVFVEAPASTAFEFDSYNMNTFKLCKDKRIGFQHHLIKALHLAEDGYHIRDKYQHLMAITVAGSVLKAIHGF